MKSQVLEQLNHIHDEFDVDTSDIIAFVEEQNSKISILKDQVDSLEDNVNNLQDEVDKPSFQYPVNFNNNIIMVSALEKMFSNLDRIPVDKLDEFVDQYAV